MKIEIEVKDEHINGALAAPHSRYWAQDCEWTPGELQGFVVAQDDPAVYGLDELRLRSALIQMAAQMPKSFAMLSSGNYDGVVGDSLLQLMAFGELRYG